MKLPRPQQLYPPGTRLDLRMPPSVRRFKISVRFASSLMVIHLQDCYSRQLTKTPRSSSYNSSGPATLASVFHLIIILSLFLFPFMAPVFRLRRGLWNWNLLSLTLGGRLRLLAPWLTSLQHGIGDLVPTLALE